ncbi:MAG: hypothetical protein JNJ99_08045, partial [Crocinitomicaceae bacterium]|nr:hypothetical protein [Crocinitomicaceae bacterium]
MKQIFVILGFLIAFSSNAQIHNRMIKFSTGISYDQFTRKNLFSAMNDSSANEFEMVTAMPVFAYSHEFVMNDVISFSGRFGFQYLNEYYNNQYFGSPFIMLSVNPQISVFYRRGFEYYVKLQAGMSFWFQHTEMLSDQQ